ncbi:uncharacterized protein MONOS_15396 [Monocercomonoides exilis]|uniref:uncharacterized protein n=1 Tax=Monocercomonoides exilis TaxID=2049356 RepID=UPI00355A5CC5|nr:hypothetical protein MONOS_15396 [Monocercomonoides exilis]|eukprot:MONOS_15396.1-p1 / transcript=MONOS_15396.1 / gene=MONOS_15396 / organism=Monocercomonoides_exilis_PA203 / gene_product=unspecified product / transcript_product=unspecified product / location=Mono_scaffold01221:337-1382(+) / protein_length=330 / sequence_SO=supercontig / SO=protein_coding / is_pseudo=false
MILEEKKKKDEKNEKLQTDLCECYLLLNMWISSELLSICVPCLLKAASKKEESEDTRKEVEMALLALCNLRFIKIEQELYLNEIKEIIQHHQEYHNLTRLAYQSAWRFLVSRLWDDNSLEKVIVVEQHFAREAARELEELSKSVDWKKNKKGGERKEKEEMITTLRWMQTLSFFFGNCYLWNEEYVELFSSIVGVLRASRDNYREISEKCIYPFEEASGRRVVKIGSLWQSGAVDVALEEIHKSAKDDEIAAKILKFFMNVSRRLKEKKKDEIEEMKRKELKRKIFEKMEEEGYEDVVTSFHKTFDFLSNKYFFDDALSLDIFDYLVNV